MGKLLAFPVRSVLTKPTEASLSAVVPMDVTLNIGPDDFLMWRQTSNNQWFQADGVDAIRLTKKVTPQ